MRVSTPWRSIRVLSWASTRRASMWIVAPRSIQPSPRRDRLGSKGGPLPGGERGEWWAHLVSNQDRTGYEPGALPIELWARGWRSWHRSRLQEAPELLGARGMAELAEGLGFDLTYALAGDREVLAHLFEGVLAAVGEPEAEPQHLLLARGERVQHLVGLLTQREPDHALHGRAHLLVLDEVAQVAVLLLADGRLEGDRLLGDLDDLADPPCGVGGELVAAAVLELVHGLHEADVAFLDQVQELEPAVRVLLGDGDDEAEVGLHHLLLGPRRLHLAGPDVLDDALEVVGARLRVLLRAPDLLLGDPHQPLLD